MEHLREDLGPSLIRKRQSRFLQPRSICAHSMLVEIALSAVSFVALPDHASVEFIEVAHFYDLAHFICPAQML
jgi:hypothetical protein